jgi:hypothetical protein
MADPIVNAVKADAVSIKAKVVAFAKAHVPTVIGAAAGFAAAKFGVIGFIVSHL